MIQPPRWTQEELESARKSAADHFREGRTTEPLETYVDLVVHNLENAQQRGLTLFWAHDLQPMLEWIHRTRESP